MIGEIRQIPSNSAEIPRKSASFRHICTIPGCKRRTSKHPNFSEWICPEHWKTVPIATRKRHLDLQKKVQVDPGRRLICATELERNWEACLQAALQAAAGIG